MKIFAGIVLLVIGLGIGYAIYMGIKPPAFTLTFSPTIVRIHKPLPPENVSDNSLMVTVERLLEYDQTVDLSHGVLPENVKVGFSPPSDVPAPKFTSTIKVVVGPNAPVGKHSVTVYAKGPDAEGSGTFTLEII
jgi:hypothetical protein